MRRHIKTFTARHEPHGRLSVHLKSGMGAMLGLGAVGALAGATGMPLLIAPLGATVVLLFGQPASSLAQPVNIFVGYLIATILAVASMAIFPGIWTATAGAVGLAIALMSALRVTHPPAGAIPLVALGAPAEAYTLFATVLMACLSLLLLALVYHRLPPRISYPKPLPTSPEPLLSHRGGGTTGP